MWLRQKLHTLPEHTQPCTPQPCIRNTHRAPYYPTQRIPGSFIKPVEELIEAIGGEMVSRPVVEPETEVKGGFRTGHITKRSHLTFWYASYKLWCVCVGQFGWSNQGRCKSRQQFHQIHVRTSIFGGCRSTR